MSRPIQREKFEGSPKEKGLAESEIALQKMSEGPRLRVAITHFSEFLWNLPSTWKEGRFVRASK